MSAKTELKSLIADISEADAEKLLPLIKKSLKPRTWADVPIVKPTAEDITEMKTLRASKEYKDLIAGKYD